MEDFWGSMLVLEDMTESRTNVHYWDSQLHLDLVCVHTWEYPVSSKQNPHCWLSWMSVAQVQLSQLVLELRPEKLFLPLGTIFVPMSDCGVKYTFPIWSLSSNWREKKELNEAAAVAQTCHRVSPSNHSPPGFRSRAWAVHMWHEVRKPAQRQKEQSAPPVLNCFQIASFCWKCKK